MHIVLQEPEIDGVSMQIGIDEIVVKRRTAAGQAGRVVAVGTRAHAVFLHEEIAPLVGAVHVELDVVEAAQTERIDAGFALNGFVKKSAAHAWKGPGG